MSPLDRALDEELSPYATSPTLVAPLPAAGGRPPTPHRRPRQQLAPRRSVGSSRWLTRRRLRRWNEWATGLCVMLGAHALLRGMEILLS